MRLARVRGSPKERVCRTHPGCPRRVARRVSSAGAGCRAGARRPGKMDVVLGFTEFVAEARPTAPHREQGDRDRVQPAVLLTMRATRAETHDHRSARAYQGRRATASRCRFVKRRPRWPCHLCVVSADFSRPRQSCTHCLSNHDYTVISKSAGCARRAPSMSRQATKLSNRCGVGTSRDPRCFPAPLAPQSLMAPFFSASAMHRSGLVAAAFPPR